MLARWVLPPTKTTHDDDMGPFYFKKKVYSNKRRGKNKDRVYNLVRIEDATYPNQEEKHSPSDDYTIIKPPVPVSNPSDVNQEEKEPDINTTKPGSDEINSNPIHTTEKVDCTSNDVQQPLPSHIEMVEEVNDQFANPHENPSFGGSGVLGILSHAWRHGQLTLKVEWSSGDTTWEPFRDLKHDYPHQTANYIVTNNVTRKKHRGDRDLQWAKKVVRDMQRALRRLDRLYDFSLGDDENIKYLRRTRKKKFKAKKTMKYGIQVPRNVKEAYLLDTKNGDTFWQDAIKLEIDSLLEMNCFDFKARNFVPGREFQRTTLHMSFDVKQDLRRKASIVAGGHQLDIIDTPTYSSTVKGRQRATPTCDRPQIAHVPIVW